MDRLLIHFEFTSNCSWFFLQVFVHKYNSPSLFFRNSISDVSRSRIRLDSNQSWSWNEFRPLRLKNQKMNFELWSAKYLSGNNLAPAGFRSQLPAHVYLS